MIGSTQVRVAARRRNRHGSRCCSCSARTSSGQSVSTAAIRCSPLRAANLERAEVRGVDLRQGDIYVPPFANDSFDLIVIHQVLHFLDDPARAIREVSRLLTPGGRLLIVDFAPHSLEFLRSDHAHLRLGFRSDTVEAWLEQSDLEVAAERTIAPPPTMPTTRRPALRRGAHRLAVARSRSTWPPHCCPDPTKTGGGSRNDALDLVRGLPAEIRRRSRGLALDRRATRPKSRRRSCR